MKYTPFMMTLMITKFSKIMWCNWRG